MSILDTLRQDALDALHATANALHADFATKLAQAGHDVSPDDHADKLVAAAASAAAPAGSPPTYADHALAQFSINMTHALLAFASQHLPAKFQPVLAAVEPTVDQAVTGVAEGSTSHTDLMQAGIGIVETAASVLVPGAAPIIALANTVVHAVEGGQSVEQAAVATAAPIAEQVVEAAAEKALPGIGGALAGEAVQLIEQELGKS